MAQAFAQAGIQTGAIEPTSDGKEGHGQSRTDIACDQAALYGATPKRGEFDPRDIWDAEDAIAAVSESFRILAEGVGPDGTQLADERESVLWGFVNMLHVQTQRLDRSVDRLTPELKELARAQDGTEIKARECKASTPSN